MSILWAPVNGLAATDISAADVVTHADDEIPLNQKRLFADLVHEDEWELDEMFHIFSHK